MVEDDGKVVFSRSISELISLLRWAFRTKEFDEVEEIFVCRELRLKKELENKKKENELLESKNELLRYQNASIEAELKEVKEKAEELLNLLDKDGNEAQNTEKRAVQKYEKLSEELKTKGWPELDEEMTIFELRDRNYELQRSKKRVEDELQLWKKRFEELGTRFSLLETKLPKMINGKAEISEKIDPPPENFSAAPAVMVGENVDSSGNGAVSHVIIHIIDSDDKFPTKAFKSSGNLRVNQGMNMEDEPSVLKRKRDLFEKEGQSNYRPAMEPRSHASALN